MRSPEPSSTFATVVAVTLWRGSDLCLLRRSASVAHDAGQWHCITGYVDDARSPAGQALQELVEETGVAADHLLTFTPCGSLTLPDARGNHWLVHTFAARLRAAEIRLNWEHDAYRWLGPRETFPAGRVWWLADVVAATRAGRSRPSPPLVHNCLSQGAG